MLVGIPSCYLMFPLRPFTLGVAPPGELIPVFVVWLQFFLFLRQTPLPDAIPRVYLCLGTAARRAPTLRCNLTKDRTQDAQPEVWALGALPLGHWTLVAG